MSIKDIIMVVIASRGKIYDDLITNYWIPFIKFINKNKLRIKIFLLFSKNSKIDDLEIIKSNLLICNNNESLIPGILEKTIHAFRVINNNYEFKYIIRTNLSTFFIVKNLLKLSSTLKTTHLYAGVIGKYGSINFCSGACFWVSKDIVEYCIENQTVLNYTLPDDVAIGKLLEKFELMPFPRFDITNNINIKDKEALLEKLIKKNYYNIRIKNINRAIDILYFKKFTNILYNAV